VAATGSSGIGRGRSDAESNCIGLAGAHLRRYQQFPAEAQALGERGDTMVAFTLDGGGRVGGVRLASGSGFASIDREAQAMVRRASPFPLPGGCLGKAYSVRLNFR
jgi:protein TonB